MRESSVLLAACLFACSKPDAAPAPASSGATAVSTVSPDIAKFTEQTHRDTCAATRSPRVELAQDQAKAWLEGITDTTKGAKYKRAHDFITAHPDYEKLPLTAFPTGIGSVDQCQDEDAKVGLDTTPKLGDMAAMKKLVAWTPPK